RAWNPPSRFDPRQVEKLVDNTLHTAGIRQNHLGELTTGFRRDVFVRQCFRESANDSQWRAEFMRYVRDKITPRCPKRFKLCRKLLEGGCEFTNLTGGLDAKIALCLRILSCQCLRHVPKPQNRTKHTSRKRKR